MADESQPVPPHSSSAGKFALGRVVATSHALSVLTQADVVRALSRHVKGDWGDLDKEDWKANEQALAHGGRLLSVFHSTADVKFYVITEWDRSVTTVLLPEDY